jgi:methyl-accepting chemotaxis protein
MILRFAAGILVCLTMFGVVACSDDDDGDSSNTGASRANGASTGAGSPPASLPDYCDELDEVKTDVDELQSAARNLNREAAQAAVTDLKTDAEAFRSALRDGGGDNDELNQAAGDLAGAVEGLETTLRQAGQQGSSVTGVIQELETQLPVIASSMNEIRQEARCN